MKKLALFASVVMLGALAASAGTIGVPQFNDGTAAVGGDLFPTSDGQAAFIALKNNDAVAHEYTILYYGMSGETRFASPNTFSIAANAARGWRPIANDAAAEGLGVTIPNQGTAVTGSPVVGNATILYTDTLDPSGRVLQTVTAGTAKTSYAYSLVP